MFHCLAKQTLCLVCTFRGALYRDRGKKINILDAQCAQQTWTSPYALNMNVQSARRILASLCTCEWLFAHVTQACGTWSSRILQVWSCCFSLYFWKSLWSNLENKLNSPTSGRFIHCRYDCNHGMKENYISRQYGCTPVWQLVDVSKYANNLSESCGYSFVFTVA